MTSSYSSFELVARGIKKKLNQSQWAAIRAVYWYCIFGHKHFFHIPIPKIGQSLKNWDAKKNLSRHQSYVVFRFLTSLGIFDKSRPTRRSSYNIKLNELGLILGRMCHEDKEFRSKKPTLEMKKTNTRIIEKPTLEVEIMPLENEKTNTPKLRSKIINIPQTSSAHARVDIPKPQEQNSEVVVDCNLSNYSGKIGGWTIELNEEGKNYVRNALEKAMREKVVLDPVAYAKGILARLVKYQFEEQKKVEDLELKAREKARQMHEETKAMLDRFDQIPTPPLEERKSILANFRANIANLGLRAN